MVIDLDKLLNTPKLAKINGDKYYFTGKICKNNHLSKRLTSARTCTECNSDLYEKNKEQAIAKSKKRHDTLKNQDKNYEKKRYAGSRESQKLYRKKNRIARNAQKKEWDLKNKKHVLEYAKKYNSKVPLDKKRRQARKSYRLHKEAFIANVAFRRAALLKRTPKWLSNLDKEMIRNIYKIAARVSKETGIKHHVDHVIPLRAKSVSGLHVPANLQLLTAQENLSKGNNYG